MKIGLLTLVTIFLSVGSISAAVILVPGEEPNIQAGIVAAVAGDTVLVADGIHTGDGNRDIDFQGKAITVMSENGAEFCVIDCEGSEIENHRGFYFNNGEDNLSIVQGFTIENGFHNTDGGGIYCYTCSPSIMNCTISNNSVLDDGGGIYCYKASPTIINCAIVGNTCDSVGGGAYFYESLSVINRLCNQ